MSNEVRVDALDIKVFRKNCNTNVDCSINTESGNLVAELKKSILKKAAVYEKEYKAMPNYEVSTPGDNPTKKKK